MSNTMMTGRQWDHLRELGRGIPGKTIPGKFSSSTYAALARKGFAKPILTPFIRYVITDAGRGMLGEPVSNGDRGSAA